MATDKHIKTFTAADIEKYHKGLLTSMQMHEMEKAALDDPFLADALEGYAVSGVNAAADIAELQKRLAAKTESGRVVAMFEQKKKPVMWWRVAAAVVLIGGAAIWASQFLTKNNKPGEMAVVPSPRQDTNNNTSKGGNTNPVPGESEKVSPATNNSGQDTKNEIAATKATTGNPGQDNDMDGAKDMADQKAAQKVTSPGYNQVKPGTEASGAVTAEAKSNDFYKEQEERRKEMAKAEEKKFKEKQVAGRVDAEADFKKDVAAAPVKKLEDASHRNRSNIPQTNIFRGRITDANNTGVPFARVSNPADNNAGTYTDANGYFTLTYPDSSLLVQVKAIGFENSNTEIQTAKPSNRIVMQDDRSLSEVVVSRQMPNTASRSANNRQMNRKLEEPEPADGWEKYDAYLANNLDAPDEIKTTERNMAGSVQVSFEVDKNGEPVNITVEKSLCPKCDKEAIRLIKEGPKWKRSANKRGRTTVTINF